MSTANPVTRPRLVSVDRRPMVMRAIEVERLMEADHPARAIWELVGRLDLSRYCAEIGSVEGRAGRDHTDPQVLICLWRYAYSRGISSAREVARRGEYEPAFQWRCALAGVSHRTFSGFRSRQKAALQDLFVQVLGMLSAEGLITLERVTLDGTKIKANAGGNTFRRKEKLEAHLQLAREQVRLMEKQSAEAEQMARRQVAARRRAARQRQSRLEAAVREKAKMATEEAKQIYAQRSRIAEFPYAWIKERCGLRQFRCRGLLKATLEATWAALSYNLIRWFARKRQPILDPAALASA
jgi:transposase